MGNKWKGNIALLITAFIWGSGFLAQKIGMAHIGPFTFNGSRQFLAALVLIPLGIRSARQSGYFSGAAQSADGVRSRWRDLFAASVVCGLFLGLGTNLQQIGLLTVSAGKSGFITSLYIVFVPVLGLVLGDRVSARLWVCVIVAMAGFGLLSLKSGLGTVSRGDIITLLSSVAFAGQILAVNHYVNDDNAILLSIGQMAVCGAASLIIAFAVEQPAAADFMKSALAVLYSALIPTSIGFTLQIVGQRYTDPSLTALILSLEAVFAALLGALILHEHMAAREALGCAVIFAATVAASLPDRRDIGDKSA